MRTNANNHCPHLPPTSGVLPITHSRPYRAECGQKFYLACLELAQNQWEQGYPAQALLQINKSFMAQLQADAPITQRHPIAYKAVYWIIQSSHRSHEFLGNPVRHYQHLATRMNFNQPLAELRVWRAWACHHLAQAILPADDFPRDERQIESEKIQIPDISIVLAKIDELSPHRHEVREIKKLLP
ncbi:hypothetical protein Rhal01_00405 [Rubritalea halochordaticola]|uniref:Uncharacterized protein n=2 Tax=Rubritalea halochordaticola TaxID=714537 RepID=A0ABP9UUV2_9BACT